MTDAELESLAARIRPLATGWPNDLLDPRRPVFLSQVHPGHGTYWYAIARSAQQKRELREYLLAFVGSSYSDFRGQTPEWDRVDTLEAEFAASLPYGFRVFARPTEADAVLKQFTRLREVLRERPVRNRVEPPSLGQLLRDFELYLRANDWSAASIQLDRLRERGQLTTDQLAGLRLRLLADQGRWRDILAAPELPGLVSGRIAVSVGESIAAAVFHESLAGFGTEIEAATHFQREVASGYGTLFRQRSAWRRPDAVNLALIADAALRLTVVEKTEASSDPLTAALEAQHSNDTERAFQLLIPASHTAESLRLLIDVALDFDDPVKARTALAAINKCDAKIRETALSRRATKMLLNELEELAQETEDKLPANWLEWLTRCSSGPWPEASKEAQRGLTAWPAPDPAEFNAAITRSSGDAFASIRDALPVFLELLLPEGNPDTRFGQAFRLLLEQLVLNDDLSPAIAPAVAEIAGAILRSDPAVNAERNEYADVVEMLSIAWKQLRRPTLFDWGLGLLDVLAEHAVHRHANVAPLVQDVVAEFARAPRHVSRGQRTLLKAICEELDVPAAIELLGHPTESDAATLVADAVSLRKTLGKRSVALLTLSDRVASVFRNLMHESYPDAKVDVVQEYSGTTRLNSAAYSADVFIVNTFDTKHAATIAVTKHRSSAATTLYPRGKNAARQLDALEDWLRTLT